MSPCLPISGALDSTYGEAKFSGNWTGAALVLPNAPHQIIGKFRHAIARALRGISVQKTIFSVFSLRSPSQVAQQVVRRLSVIVATVMNRTWARSNECLKNHDMNSSHPGFVIHGKIDGGVAFQASIGRANFARDRSCPGVLIVDLMRDGPDSSMIRNFIEPFKADNRSPFFDHIHQQSYVGGAHLYYQIRRTYG